VNEVADPLCVEVCDADEITAVLVREIERRLAIGGLAQV
jgi:hypothetical protein